MIKVIASDMDGTLLGNDHKVAPETLKAIHEACDAGIRFMIATGRNFKGAMEELKETDIFCDYILNIYYPVYAVGDATYMYVFELDVFYR